MSLGEAEAEEMTDVSTTCAGTVSAINLKDGGESSIDDRSLGCTTPGWWWWCVATTTAAGGTEVGGGWPCTAVNMFRLSIFSAAPGFVMMFTAGSGAPSGGNGSTGYGSIWKMISNRFIIYVGINEIDFLQYSLFSETSKEKNC